MGELESSPEIVVHCKMGGRSAKAVAFLQQAGFKRVHISGQFFGERMERPFFLVPCRGGIGLTLFPTGG